MLDLVTPKMPRTRCSPLTNYRDYANRSRNLERALSQLPLSEAKAKCTNSCCTNKLMRDMAIMSHHFQSGMTQECLAMHVNKQAMLILQF